MVQNGGLCHMFHGIRGEVFQSGRGLSLWHGRGCKGPSRSMCVVWRSEQKPRHWCWWIVRNHTPHIYIYNYIHTHHIQVLAVSSLSNSYSWPSQRISNISHSAPVLIFLGHSAFLAPTIKFQQKTVINVGTFAGTLQIDTWNQINNHIKSHKIS